MNNTQTHYGSLLGFLLFTFSALLLFGLAFFLGISLLFSYLNSGVMPMPITIYTFTTAFLGLLVGTAAVIALLRFLNKPAALAPVSTTFPLWQIAVSVAGAALVLLVGYLLQNNEKVNWLILPVLTIPAVLFPLWIIVGLGVRGIPLGSRWRTWGALGVSITLTPFILVLIEIIMIVVVVTAVVMYVGTQPNLTAQFERLGGQLMFLDPQSEAGMEQILKLLAPFLLRPVVLIPLLTMFSLFIPLVEEFFKPLVVWIIGKRLDSAGQGFAFGAMSGAGFAIWETFNVSGQMAEWGSTLLSRVGTGLLHITTSALMGMAIVLAWRERRYLRLLGTYLLVVLLHGLWNAAAIIISFSTLVVAYSRTEGLRTLQWAAIFVMILLIGALLAMLITFNRKLRQAAEAQQASASPPLAEGG